MVVGRIKLMIKPGMVIPKPDAKSDFIIKGWGKRRGEDALIYYIPNHRNPNKPYQKGIAVSEWEQAFHELMETGSFSREWFNEHMEPCMKEGTCNFTTIGGIFELLGLARYERGDYRRA